MKEIDCDGLELRSSSGPLESALVSLCVGDEESTATGTFREVEVESAGLHECQAGDDLIVWNTKDNKSELHFTLEKCDYDFHDEHQFDAWAFEVMWSDRAGLPDR